MSYNWIFIQININRSMHFGVCSHPVIFVCESPIVQPMYPGQEFLKNAQKRATIHEVKCAEVSLRLARSAHWAMANWLGDQSSFRHAKWSIPRKIVAWRSYAWKLFNCKINIQTADTVRMRICNPLCSSGQEMSRDALTSHTQYLTVCTRHWDTQPRFRHTFQPHRIHCTVVDTHHLFLKGYNITKSYFI